MSTHLLQQPLAGTLPQGIRPVALEPSGGGVVVLAILVRDRDAEPVVVRELSDGTVYLGCLISPANAVVREYLEIWVQRAGQLAGSPSAMRGEVNNAALDERWARLADSFRTGDPAGVVPFESEGRPLLIDPRTFTLVPLDPTSDFRLARDSAQLASAGAADYASTLHRYLSDGFSLITATEGAPAGGEGTKSLAKLLKERALIAVNPEGGVVIVRRHVPLNFEGFIDYLGGAAAEESLARGRVADVAASTGSGEDTAVNQWLFASGAGTAGRALEVLHLKLCLIADAVESVRRHVGTTQVPLLNVTADSFRIGIGSIGSRLPHLWTARAEFVGAGDAIEIPMEGAEGRYFLPLRSVGSPYRAAVATRRVEGFGMLRLRRVVEEGGGVSCEATLSSQDRFRISKNDLLWVRIGTGRRRTDMWAHVETQSSLAAGEWRLRTLKQAMPAEAVAQLKDLEGQIVGEVPFELLPALSTPCDLFSLAVLAMRVLLVNSLRALPSVIDDLLSLSSEVRQAESKQPLGARIEETLKSDPRWMESLGAGNLLHEPGTSDGKHAGATAAAEAVPMSIWREVLALIVRMVPGSGPDAFRGDYGDAPPSGLQRVFDAPLAEWQTLAARSRSLLVLDWKANREIDAIIRGEIGSSAGAGASSSTAGQRASPAKVR